MTAIHELSQLAPLPEFDLFGVPPTQTTVLRDAITEHRPISTVSADSVITFVVPTAIDEYIQLRESLLQMRIRIDLKKTVDGDITADDWKKVSPVNYLLHSMFKQIDLEIDGKLVTATPQTYPYRAIFESMFGFTEDARNSHMTAAMWYKDEDEKESISVKRSALITPSPVKTSGEGKEIELLGKLHLDLAFQGRALLGGSTLKITLVPHSPSFYLHALTGYKPTVTFLDATLRIHRSKVSPLIAQAHQIALNSATAKYPIARSEVRSFNIASGTQDVIIDNVIHGQLPRRAIVAFVSTNAFNGDLTKNPYNFRHFNLDHLAAHLDGQQYPSQPYTPNFTKNLYTREYMGLFESLNELSTDSCIKLNVGEWAKGNTMFGFNFAPDLSDGCDRSGHINPIQRGTMRLEMRFSTALTETINALVFCEYDNLIQVDRERQASTDFV